MIKHIFLIKVILILAIHLTMDLLIRDFERNLKAKKYKLNEKRYFCPQCGWLLDSNGLCNKCGKRLKDYWKKCTGIFFCPTCKMELNKLGPYCARCGKKIPTAPKSVCPNCKNEINKIGPYCQKCGAEI